MTVPSYTEQDVELLRAAFREQYPAGGCDCGDCQNGLARAVLAALSSAGRLVPPGSEVRHGKDHCEVCYDMGHAAGWNEGSTEATVRSW